MSDLLSGKANYIALLIILLLATYLRFTGLDEPGLWLDEVSYTKAAQKPILDQITNSTETLGGYLSVDPTLSAIPFSLSLKLGFSNFLARFPAALFGILGVALIYRLGQSVFDRRVGLVAALLFATSSFHILYSQEARSYAQFVFFSMASFLFLYQAFTKNEFIYWGLYTVCIWAGVSTNHLMLFAIGVQTLFLFLACLQDIIVQRNYSLDETKASLRIFGYFLLSLGVVFVLRIPWLEDFTERQCAGCDIGTPSYSLDLANSVSRSLESFANNSLLVTVIFMGLSLSGLVVAFLCYTSPRGMWLATWLILPLPVTTAGLWFISQFFHPRYTIWGLPAFLLAVACSLIGIGDFALKFFRTGKQGSGSEKFAKFSIYGSIGLGVMFIVAHSLWQAQQNPIIKQGWPTGMLQEATHYIAAQANKDEVIIGVPNAQHVHFYMQYIRQDLNYLDIHTRMTLPPELAGRWYVFYGAWNIPDRWQKELTYREFHDILVVHRPTVCKIEACIKEAKTLLSEIAKANPDSAIEEKATLMLSGLSQPSIK